MTDEPRPADAPMIRIVTREQLAKGFVIRWPDGRQVWCDYVVVRELPGDLFEVKEPHAIPSFVFDAPRKDGAQ